jgi:integrase
MRNNGQRKKKGEAQVRQEERAGGVFWGYDVWIRQPDGSRKRFRDFSFNKKLEAQQALAALRLKGNKGRYSLTDAPKEIHTTVKSAALPYIEEQESKQIINRTEETNYWRQYPGHLRTLDRFIEWIGPTRVVSTISKQDFLDWIKAEQDRAKAENGALKQSTIRRGLNTIRAALNHAVNSGNFDDLRAYKVPSNPLKKKVETDRDRVLSNEEILQIATALAANPEYEEALFFFQLDLITGARMDELLRLRWEHSSTRFGTIKLYSSKTEKWRTIKAPAATELIEKRRKASLGGPVRLLTKKDMYFRKIFGRISKRLGIRYGQKVPDGWTIHDLRHTCLTNLALAGVPLHGIKEFAGHASITETERYLKYMPEQVELAASVSTYMAQLANLKPKALDDDSFEVQCPKCDNRFQIEAPRKHKHLRLVVAAGQ